MIGIDISENNGTIDWSQVKTNAIPVNFAYIKLTEGVGCVDKQAANNATRALAAGLRIGYYHFASLNNLDVVNDATSEANDFCRVLKTVPGAQLPPVLDIETNKSNLTPAQVYNWIITFLRVMKQNGYPDVVLYSYTPFLNVNLPPQHDLGRTKLWLAQYTKAAAPTLPRGWANYWLWQYTNQGRVNGFKSNVDCNQPPQGIVI